MRSLLVLALIPLLLGPLPETAADLVARLAASPDEATGIIVEVRTLDEEQRRQFLALASSRLSIDVLSGAAQELVALGKLRADRWALELCEWLPRAHGFRRVGARLLARVWTEKAILRQLRPIQRGEDGTLEMAMPLLRLLQHRECGRKVVDLLVDIASKPPRGTGSSLQVLAIRALPAPGSKVQVRYLIQMANSNAGFYRSMSLDWWAPKPTEEK